MCLLRMSHEAFASLLGRRPRPEDQGIVRDTPPRVPTSAPAETLTCSYHGPITHLFLWGNAYSVPCPDPSGASPTSTMVVCVLKNESNLVPGIFIIKQDACFLRCSAVLLPSPPVFCRHACHPCVFTCPPPLPRCAPVDSDDDVSCFRLR